LIVSFIVDDRVGQSEVACKAAAAHVLDFVRDAAVRRSESVVIVGAGIAGLVASLMLARRGYRCTLYDADGAARGCSLHAGGMLAPISELDLAEPRLARLGLDAVERWRALLGEDARGRSFDAEGSLIVAHRPEWPLLEQLYQRARAAGLDASLSPVGAEEIAALEPWMAGGLRRGLSIPSEGVVHPAQALAALRERVIAAGVEHHEAHVDAVEAGAIVVGGERRQADWVVDCRGLGSRPALPLRGVRGEYLIVRAATLRPRRPIRLMHPRYPLYLVPRPDGSLYVGATQLESEHEGPMQVRSALELLSALYSLAPGFADASVETLGVGLRPALSSNLPLLQIEPGLLALNGLFRHGYLLAPLMCEWLVDAVESRPLPERAGPFIARLAAVR
jgi:glycine oxidase